MDYPNKRDITAIVSGIRPGETDRSTVDPLYDIPPELSAGTTEYAINGTSSASNIKPKAREIAMLKG